VGCIRRTRAPRVTANTRPRFVGELATGSHADTGSELSLTSSPGGFQFARIASIDVSGVVAFVVSIPTSMRQRGAETLCSAGRARSDVEPPAVGIALQKGLPGVQGTSTTGGARRSRHRTGGGAFRKSRERAHHCGETRRGLAPTNERVLFVA